MTFHMLMFLNVYLRLHASQSVVVHIRVIHVLPYLEILKSWTVYKGYVLKQGRKWGEWERKREGPHVHRLESKWYWRHLFLLYLNSTYSICSRVLTFTGWNQNDIDDVCPCCISTQLTASVPGCSCSPVGIKVILMASVPAVSQLNLQHLFQQTLRVLNFHLIQQRSNNKKNTFQIDPSLLALSKITTLLRLTTLCSSNCGSRWHSRKSQNRSSLTLLVVIYTSMVPSMHIAAIAEYCFPLTNDFSVIACVPLKA